MQTTKEKIQTLIDSGYAAEDVKTEIKSYGEINVIMAFVLTSYGQLNQELLRTKSDNIAKKFRERVNKYLEDIK